MAKSSLLLLGVGQVARAILAAAPHYDKIYATTRNPNRIFELFEAGVEPIIMPMPSDEIIEPLAMGSDVVVSFPPDGTTDAILAPACRRAKALVYVSSTGVYGNYSGRVDEHTPVDDNHPHAELRLEAERLWKSAGANIVRAPGIYGPESGLHTRLKEGAYRMPGKGENVLSRIHVEDLAAIILRILELQLRKETFVVGDLEPASQAEVVAWLCERMGLPMPESVPPEAVSHTLRGNRAVDPRHALRELGINLRYPSYREGFEQCLGAASRSAG